MNQIAAFQSLEDRFGREQATAIAEFMSSKNDPDLSRFVTKEDLTNLELRLVKELAKTREDMITRMNWTTIIQVLTTVGALIAIAKII
jgi:hypothetical protein